MWILTAINCLTLTVFLGAVTQPLPTSYLIFRAPSQAAGKCWLDALELSVRCSSLVRSSSLFPKSPQMHDESATNETQWSVADCEKHFDEHGKCFISCLYCFFLSYFESRICKSREIFYSITRTKKKSQIIAWVLESFALYRIKI